MRRVGGAPAAEPPAVNTQSIDARLSVDHAATFLGRDRSRIYALVRSGDLAAVQDGERAELRLASAH